MPYVSAAQAAVELGVDPARVRALVAGGELEGEKLAGRWLVDSASLALRVRSRPPAGRPFAPHNAWALIFLASELDPSWVSPSRRSQLRRALRLESFEKLAPRLARRAQVHHFRAHPGELARVRSDGRLVLAGASAAGGHGLDLLAGAEVDSYVSEAVLKEVVRDHVLDVASPAEANLILRSVASPAWPFESGSKMAPLAAVALDLSEDLDRRSVRLGRELLARLSRESQG
ncbi:MAG: hypothetical protein QOI91_2808 [Solirubrobacteraceae bacterium]|jgi:hypothetical protein|nr:hypothetical protein [Solirubrobacteraceae bacterium]